jgi:outer membrane protein OmpA-like peptidoglycan-associated protein
MRKKLLVCWSAAALVGACSSAPKLAVPDGRHRTPVNSPPMMEKYKAASFEEKLSNDTRTSMKRQLDQVSGEVGAIKSFLASLPEDAGVLKRPGGSVRTSAPVASAIERAPAIRTLSKGKPGESMEVREQSVIFRVTFPTSGTRFNPTQSLQNQLLKAAGTARLLDVRGRSDTDVANKASERIALERARRARQFLLDHGVPPGKVRISAMAAGGFIAANVNEAGRARNRRVEIEAMDLDTSSYQQSDPITHGGSE